MGYQLFAHDVWWRVVEIITTTESYDGKAQLVTGRVEYRKTRAAAEKLRDRWASESPVFQGAVVQGGIVTWYPDDELQSAFNATDFNRQQNVDDRDEDQ